jgi:hypothetical protein
VREHNTRYPTVQVAALTVGLRCKAISKYCPTLDGYAFCATPTKGVTNCFLVNCGVETNPDTGSNIFVKSAKDLTSCVK